MKKKKFFVFADGGSRGNPGPAAIGFLVKTNQGKVLVRKGKRIGEATNNVAEYMAVIGALKWLDKNLKKEISDKEVIVSFFLDSKLVVNQLNGFYKIKNKNLQKLVIEVKKFEQKIRARVCYYRIAREKNKNADWLVNKAFSKGHP